MSDDEEPSGIKRYDRADQGRKENLRKKVEKEQGKKLDSGKAQLQSEMNLKQLKNDMADSSHKKEKEKKEEEESEKGFQTETMMEQEQKEREQGSAQREADTDDIAEEKEAEPSPEEGMMQAG